MTSVSLQLCWKPIRSVILLMSNNKPLIHVSNLFFYCWQEYSTRNCSRAEHKNPALDTNHKQFRHAAHQNSELWWDFRHWYTCTEGATLWTLRYCSDTYWLLACVSNWTKSNLERAKYKIRWALFSFPQYHHLLQTCTIRIKSDSISTLKSKTWVSFLARTPTISYKKKTQTVNYITKKENEKNI